MRASDYGTNFHAPRVDIHRFSMIPRSEIPRSAFRMQSQHKTTFSASHLIPFYLQEVLPGDTFNVRMTAMVRMATPIVPIMDNLELETFFFFVPNRLVWVHWYRFMGEQDNPTDSISYSIPQIVSPVNGFAQLSVYDYFGLPTAGQTLAGNTISVSALPLRAYSLIWNQWFRDENLNVSMTFGSGGGVGIAAMDDGPDPASQYVLKVTNKRHDYFTACLPWTQKGGVVSTPLAGQALVKTSSTAQLWNPASASALQFSNAGTGAWVNTGQLLGINAAAGASYGTGTLTSPNAIFPSNLYADLSTATATTINVLRLAFQTQKLLERDARGGTRYTEIIRAHFGVISPDMRLQRPEYLGGGRTPVVVAPVPQTTATGLTGGSSPLGTLAAVGTAAAHAHGFRGSFTEHGHIIGVCCVRQDMGYQQGIRRLWSRKTRYDFYFPVFAALGEQGVLNQEIFSDGSANDAAVFGYQERWAEYRYHPSYTSAYFRSTTSTPLDFWHLVEKFGGLPGLSGSWMQDSTSINMQRVLAGGAASQYQQFLADFFFDQHVARPMPLYSVPGMIDHF